MDRLADEGVKVDGVATDPPYHLASIVSRLGNPDAAPIQSGQTGVYARSSAGFMGQRWDGGDIAFRVDTWRRVFALMKPGAHLIAFSHTRTYHRMVCAIEDAGFEIRDMMPWLYGTGFPKSHNLDGEWEGWGTALKPALEPVVLARKPLIGSIAENMAMFGTGAINIDACRVPIAADEAFDGGGQSRNGVRVDTHHDGWRRPWMNDEQAVIAHRDRLRAGVAKARQLGRWPANLAHDGSEEVLDAFAAFGEREGERHHHLLEGIAFAMARHIRIMEASSGKRLERMIAAGGGARTKLWLKIKASVFDTPVLVPQEPECGLVGCAAMAATATGRFSRTEDAAEAYVRYDEEIAPDPAWAEIYSHVQPVFDRLYHHSKALYDDMDALAALIRDRQPAAT